MRILTIIHLYPPHHLGGYEIACQGVMERLRERGHEVLVLASDTHLDGTDERSMPSTVDVRRQLHLWWDWDSFVAAEPSRRDRIRYERQNQRAIREALDEFQPDVVSIWSLGYLSFSVATIVEQRGVPIVLTFLDDWICWVFRFDAWTRTFSGRRWAFPLARMVGLTPRLPTFATASASVASNWLGDRIDEHSPWKFPAAPVIPIGVDTDVFPIGTPRAGEWAWRMLYVGRVVPDKGVRTLVTSLADLPSDARLEIVGHGPDDFVRELHDLAAELGATDRVAFSRASREDLRERYRAADVVVFPSEWPEPFGIVPLEAMACGTPVVATGTGGSADFLEDGTNCVLFPPGDAAALAVALRRLADDGQLRDRIVAGGLETAKGWTVDDYAEALEELHGRAATRARRA